MASEPNGDVRRRKSPTAEAEAPSTAAEFKGTSGSLFHAIFAISLWLGSVHIIALIVLVSFIFFPFPKSLGFVIALFELFLVHHSSIVVRLVEDFKNWCWNIPFELNGYWIVCVCERNACVLIPSFWVLINVWWRPFQRNWVAGDICGDSS